MAKLSFFKTAASLVELFLREFQSEDPLAPLLHRELTDLTTTIMQRVVKQEVLAKNTSVIKVQMTSDNLIPVMNVDLEFLTKSAPKNAKPSDELVLNSKSIYIYIFIFIIYIYIYIYIYIFIIYIYFVFGPNFDFKSNQ